MLAGSAVLVLGERHRRGEGPRARRGPTLCVLILTHSFQHFVVTKSYFRQLINLYVLAIFWVEIYNFAKAPNFHFSVKDYIKRHDGPG